MYDKTNDRGYLRPYNYFNEILNPQGDCKPRFSFYFKLTDKSINAIRI